MNDSGKVNVLLVSSKNLRIETIARGVLLGATLIRSMSKLTFFI